MIPLLVNAQYAPRMVRRRAEVDDDATLARRITACAPGLDTSAEAELCRRLGPRIRLYGLKHLRSESAARDLAQDVLVLLLEKLRGGALRDPGQVASFALGSARQRVLDVQRGERRRKHLREAFPADLLPAMEEPPEPRDTTRLTRCLAALPERERTVLVMTFYDERPADEVAADLGLTTGNVRVIRHRGLERLRGCMQAAEGAV
jgi:RNA polymerase sigma-70 factor (ECF subfamily)